MQRLIRGLASVVLWLGLVLCIIIFYRSWDSFSALQNNLAWGHILVLLVLMAGIAFTGILSWMNVVQAIAGISLAPSIALRQMALLLVGKYIPGGVVGFLARLYDGTAHASAARLAASGIFEQCLGLAVVSVCGLIVYLSALKSAWLLLLLLPVPWVALSSVHAILMVLRILPISRVRASVTTLVESRPAMKQVLFAAIFTQVSTLCWLIIVVFVSVKGYGLGTSSAIGVAGAFSIGVAAGLVAIIVPGGIGVREAVTMLLAMPFMDGRSSLALVTMLRVLTVAFDLFVGLSAMAASVLASRHHFGEQK
jgi:uncharacterized membrane protein YbhN (UPF0104 family)